MASINLAYRLFGAYTFSSTGILPTMALQRNWNSTKITINVQTYILQISPEDIWQVRPGSTGPSHWGHDKMDRILQRRFLN